MARITDERPKQALKTDVLVVGGGAQGLRRPIRPPMRARACCYWKSTASAVGPQLRVSRAPFAGCSGRPTTAQRRPSESF